MVLMANGSKSGPRKHNKDSNQKYLDNYNRIFNKPKEKSK